MGVGVGAGLGVGLGVSITDGARVVEHCRIFMMDYIVLVVFSP